MTHPIPPDLGRAVRPCDDRALAPESRAVGKPLLSLAPAVCCGARVDEITLTITLRPERAGDGVHVEGVVDLDGEQAPFTGWMALLGVLEAHAERQVSALDPR